MSVRTHVAWAASFLALVTSASFQGANAGWITSPETIWVVPPKIEARVFGGPPAGNGCGTVGNNSGKTALVDGLLNDQQCDTWPPDPDGSDLAAVGLFDDIGVASAITGVFVGPGGGFLTADVLMISEAERVEGNLWAYRWTLENFGTGTMTDYFDAPRNGPEFPDVPLLPGEKLTETSFGGLTGPPAVGAWGGLWEINSGQIGIFPNTNLPQGVELPFAPPRLHPLGLLEFLEPPVLDPLFPNPPPPFKIVRNGGGIGGGIGGRIVLVAEPPAIGTAVMLVGLAVLWHGRRRRTSRV